MRRHPSLIPLSRFHRSGLFVAQMCKSDGPKFKGYPTTPETKATYTVDFFHHDLKAHFELEETALFPLLGGLDPQLDELIARALDQHVQLAEVIEEISIATKVEPVLDTFGRLLETHIRMEERQLFQRAQEVASGTLETVKLD